MVRQDKKTAAAVTERVTSELSIKVRDLTRLVEKDECRITLWVSHPTMKASEISAALELDPFFANGEGDKILRDGKTHWTFSSQGKISSNLFEDHLKWMLDQLFGKLPAVRLLQDQGAEFRLEAFTEQWSPVAAMVLKTETIQHLFQLRMPLVFMVHQNSSTF